MQQLQHQTLCFGDFMLDLTRGCLRRGDEEIKLRPKSFEVPDGEKLRRFLIYHYSTVKIDS